MLFSHAVIVRADNGDESDNGTTNTSILDIEYECVNPKERMPLFEGSFLSIWVSIFYLLYFMMGLVAVGGNCLILMAVVKFQWLQVTTNFLVASLAASDLLIGVCIVGDCVLYHFDMCAFHYEECILTTCIQTIAVLASNLNLLQASYDRHLYISAPLHYNSSMRKRRLRITIPLVWVYSVVLGVVPLIPTLTSDRSAYRSCVVYKLYPYAFMIVLVCVNFYALYVIVLAFYIHIWRIAAKHKRKISKVIKAADSTAKTNWKSTKMLAMITVSLFVLSMPYTIVVLYLMACPDCEIRFPVLLLIYVCFYATTCANFVIYAWYSKDFKAAFRLILMSCFGSKANKKGSKHSRPHKESHVKQIFKTDKALDMVSPPARRKFAVAGLEFNRHLPNAARTYVRGGKVSTSETTHAYDNPALVHPIKDEVNFGSINNYDEPGSNHVSISIHNTDIVPFNSHSRINSVANETVITHSGSDVDSDQGEVDIEVASLNTLDHNIKLQHKANRVQTCKDHGNKISTSQENSGGKDLGIHELIRLKKVVSLPLKIQNGPASTNKVNICKENENDLHSDRTQKVEIAHAHKDLTNGNETTILNVTPSSTENIDSSNLERDHIAFSRNKKRSYEIKARKAAFIQTCYYDKRRRPSLPDIARMQEPGFAAITKTDSGFEDYEQSKQVPDTTGIDLPYSSSHDPFNKEINSHTHVGETKKMHSFLIQHNEDCPKCSLNIEQIFDNNSLAKTKYLHNFSHYPKIIISKLAKDRRHNSAIELNAGDLLNVNNCILLELKPELENTYV